MLCPSSLKLFKSTPLSLTAMINTALSEALPNNRERRVKHCAVSRGCSLRCVAGIAVSHRSARGLAPSLRRKALISPVSQAWPSMCVIFLCAVRNGLLHVSRSRSLQLPCHFRRHHQAGIRAGAGERKGAYKSRFKNMEIDISFHCNHVVDWCQWVYACFGRGRLLCSAEMNKTFDSHAIGKHNARSEPDSKVAGARISLNTNENAPVGWVGQ